MIPRTYGGYTDGGYACDGYTCGGRTYDLFTRRDRKRLRRRASLVCPDATARAALLMAAVLLAGALLWVGIAHGEEDVSLSSVLTERRLVTEKWQTLRMDKDATVTVWLTRPEPMELGDSISFFCTFEGCHRDNFVYNWQYGDGRYWTSFGSKPCKNTIYSPMLAGQRVRLVMAWR